MRRTLFRRALKVMRDVEEATEVQSTLRSMPYKQRLNFLGALHDDVMRHEAHIMEANRWDCDAFAQQQHSAVSTRPCVGEAASLSSSSSPSLLSSASLMHGAPALLDGRSQGLPYRRQRIGTHHELSPLHIKKLLTGIEGLMQLPDPIAPPTGDVAVTRSSCVSRAVSVRDVPVPLGLVGILARNRPRVTLDAVAMCIQSGNAVLIDGGASVLHTNRAMMASVRRSLVAADIPTAAVVFVEPNGSEHDATAKWLEASDSVDLGIVCGDARLYRFACQHATIPLIKAAGRACSLYVDKSADYETALGVVLNAKFQRPNATNAIHTLILHEAYPRFHELLQALKSRGVLLLGDAAAEALAPSCIDELASEEVYKGLTEGLLDFHRVLCVKTVRDVKSAVYFLNRFGSKQSDGIIATDEDVIREYSCRVDTAVALVNASTRLSSGRALGRGTDLAIATSKVHSRGPFTLSALTTRKIVVRCAEPGGALRL
ncbi:gamma-glutamyl phosphate reductase-like protein [Trypanosoma grayi]|uniref:gamma-glutamyl phosphate reductase-like protein n=1 Tax=Trypanosoma grayi TaxID=71804 RepID=UPI0004F48EF7|nr:gamma-glutamyl phosphate reductase-like protein [Trypanosoma grayi]KEG07522.1 gamma-glutamyl phosphate reductase-like protein [Trypanosoma grayi]